MTRRRFVLQAAFVVALAVFVSWPQFTSVRAASVWMYAPAATVEGGADALRNAQLELGAGDLALQALAGDGALFGTTGAGDGAGGQGQGGRDTFVTPFDVWELGGELNAIVGRARTLQNQPIPFATVVLRDILTGQVIARALANEEGLYQFLDVDASAYIVELLGDDGSVIAASSAVAVELGSVQETLVRAGARASQLLVGSSSQQNPFNQVGDELEGTLDETTDEASNQDVTRNDPGTQNPASPRR
jgi:hypothetical protein